MHPTSRPIYCMNNAKQYDHIKYEISTKWFVYIWLDKFKLKKIEIKMNLTEFMWYVIKICFCQIRAVFPNFKRVVLFWNEVSIKLDILDYIWVERINKENFWLLSAQNYAWEPIVSLISVFVTLNPELLHVSLQGCLDLESLLHLKNNVLFKKAKGTTGNTTSHWFHDKHTQSN